MPAPSGAAGVRAVVFDVGETLVDETAEYGGWADWLGVPRHTFSAVFGAVVARGGHHREALQHFRPGFQLAAERLRRERAGLAERLGEGDLYPDARACLERLQRLGLLVGVAANQTAQAEARLRALGLPVDFIATSAGWGVEKPDPAFFDRVVAACGCPAGEVAYVGDRLDNDVLPALAAGMVAVFLRRGPWGHLHAAHPDAARAHLRVASLQELADRLADRGTPLGTR
jgi:HAD superfamily hydrolase (TIGR01549 family)